MAKDPYKYFRVEAGDLTDQLSRSLLELERVGSGGEVVPRLLRLAHTLKGAARVVRQPEIADQAHMIEDLLTPYRDQAASVPRTSIEAVLQLIDGIANKILVLSPPQSPPEQPGPTNLASAEEPVGPVRADATEIDDLLSGVTETNAQLVGLRDVAVLAGRIRRLSDEILEQLSGTAPRGPGSVDATASAEKLRGIAANIELTVAATHGRIDRELRHLRDAAEQLKLTPAQALFVSLERTARDAAQVLGKEVLFEALGGDIRLDTHVIRRVQDGLVQLIRNAVAHGIEVPRDRLAAGKERSGRVTVSVLRRGRQIVFRCEDDGRGIDIAALREAAIRKGRPVPVLDHLATGELVGLLLAGGVTTSAVVSEVAGRGIGMDIVRETVAQLGAELAVTTEAGKGTRFELIVPLSVSFVQALVLEASGAKVTLPLHAVRHTLRIEPGQIHRTSLGQTIIHDGQAIPLVSLAKMLGRGTAKDGGVGNLSVVVVAGATGVVAVA
ncbi:MAG TPA: ATP-binding protein, partial [Devosia sp.]|nr:ATP-binding protein [Devosia sp.]